MTDIFCRYIGEISLESTSDSYLMQFVINIAEEDNIVKVTSGAKIQELQRGWFGNLNCNTDKAMNIKGEELDNINPIHCIKDVVLKDIQIESDRERATYFTYVFLKI